MYNTLDCYGTSGSDGFLDEGEMPDTTDSSYTRHAVGGNHGEQETAHESTASVISVSQN